VKKNKVLISGLASIITLLKKRPADSNKFTFGHTLIIAGSTGKGGAALLSSEAALRTGCGLVSSLVPKEIISAMLCRIPEVMTIDRETSANSILNESGKFNSIAIGPGIGLDDFAAEMLREVLVQFKGPIVIDADGLNLISMNKDWFKLLKDNIILTPHIFEFDRLTKKHNTDAQRIESQIEFSVEYGVNILLKGPKTSITNTKGERFINTTGNNGMATAGSGDVLTGIIGSLCAQGYEPIKAAIIGAYIHGYAGDRAAEKKSSTSMIASDIIACIPDFFLTHEVK
jgi:NAD(P)H-hydrate epimerase